MAMDFAPALSIFGGMMRGIGTGMSAAGYRDAASARRAEAAYQASALERRAKDQVAAGMRGAAEERRQGELAISRIRAVAAASGGGATDPTVINLIAGAASEAEYRARIAMYQGESNAAAMREQAKLTRYGAEYEARGYETLAVTTLIGGLAGSASTYASLLDTYGPKTTGASASLYPTPRMQRYAPYRERAGW